MKLNFIGLNTFCYKISYHYIFTNLGFFKKCSGKDSFPHFVQDGRRESCTDKNLYVVRNYSFEQRVVSLSVVHLKGELNPKGFSPSLKDGRRDAPNQLYSFSKIPSGLLHS